MSTKPTATSSSSSSSNISSTLNEIYKAWPEEPSRPGRSYKEHLMNRENLAEDVPYLKYIVNNEAKKKYGIFKKFKPLHRPAYGLLSSEAQKTIPKLKTRDFILPIAQFNLARMMKGLGQMLMYIKRK